MRESGGALGEIPRVHGAGSDVGPAPAQAAGEDRSAAVGVADEVDQALDAHLVVHDPRFGNETPAVVHESGRLAEVVDRRRDPAHRAAAEHGALPRLQRRAQKGSARRPVERGHRPPDRPPPIRFRLQGQSEVAAATQGPVHGLDPDAARLVLGDPGERGGRRRSGLERCRKRAGVARDPPQDRAPSGVELPSDAVVRDLARPARGPSARSGPGPRLEAARRRPSRVEDGTVRGCGVHGGLLGLGWPPAPGAACGRPVDPGEWFDRRRWAAQVL